MQPYEVHFLSDNLDVRYLWNARGGFTFTPHYEYRNPPFLQAYNAGHGPLPGPSRKLVLKTGWSF